jgi:tetratricopeptide (TPR) repeat protein
LGPASSLDELKAAIASGKALLVCGAGVSEAVAGPAAPNWKRLIESAIESAPKAPGEDWSAPCKGNLASSDPDLWLLAARVAQKKLGGFDSQPYRAWLKQSVGKLSAKDSAKDSILLESIKSLNCRVATTNYDALLCDHLGVQPKTWRNPAAVAEILSGEHRNVWHIHGYWDEPESVIFSAADYDRVRRSDLAQFLQQSAAFTDTLIFIGCSIDGLADQNIGRLLQWFEQNWNGLGKKHFALVRDADLNAPGWPASVARVAYGAEYDNLPKFMRTLAPTPPDAVNSIESLIPATPTFGRGAEIAKVVAAALHPRPCIVTGAPGMGKTKVAIAAAYDPAIVARFGRRRVFVNLETRSDPLDIVILLASELGLKPEPKLDSVLAAIRHACGQARALAILDNAEGLIEANQAETARILGLIANIPDLSIVLTSRESLVGLAGWEKVDDLPPLPLDEARALFCSIATATKPDDPDLQPLLIAMDGHALSLTILASRVDSDLSLKPMLERWRREKAKLLAMPGAVEDRLNSVRASLRVSLTSTHMTAVARRLLAILGFLPAGLPAGGLKAFLGHEDHQLSRDKSDAAEDVLRRLRLIMPRADGSLRLINPLRECIRLEWPLKSPDLERVTSAGLKLLRKAELFGTDQWPEAKAELDPHIDNFAAILIAAGRGEPAAKLEPAIEHARRLASEDNRLAATIFLDLAEALRARPNSASTVAAALFAAGDHALRRNDLDGAKTHLEAARTIAVRLGTSVGEANALHSLGELALRHRDLDGAKPYLEAARAIFVRIGDNHGEANTLRSLGNLAGQRHDLDGAKTRLEAARAICVRLHDNLGEANALHSLGELALRRNDLDGAKTHLEAARAIFVWIGESIGEVNADWSLGVLALLRSDLDGAKTHLEAARTIAVRLGTSVGEANALHSLGELALRRDDLDGANTHLQAARTIFVRIGESVGEGITLESLGELSLRRDDFGGAKTLLEAARTIFVRIGDSLDEANAVFTQGLILTQQHTVQAEATLREALEKYRILGNAWGIAHCSLRLAQIGAARGDSASLAAATELILAHETHDPAKRAAPGWRAYCASLTEENAQKRDALREQARAAWTAIGALGLAKGFLDFKIEVRP